MDFHGKIIRGDTYQHTTSANTPAKWGVVGGADLSNNLKTAVTSICSAVDAKMTGTPLTGDLADGGTDIPNEDQVHTFVTGLGYLTSSSLSNYAVKSSQTQELVSKQIKLVTQVETPLILPHTASNGIVIGSATSASTCRITLLNDTVKVIGRNAANSGDVDLLTITINE